MKKAHRFPTGSRFDGSMNELFNCMDGFGVYVYPDGSEYRGYFRNGRFHGFGRIRLSSPYKFSFKGNFDMGQLVEIENMVFGDGLHINGTFDETGLNADDWSYLTEHDRRYSTEILNGLEAVGPSSSLTRTKPTRRLPHYTFDTEEGVYRPTNGFVTDRPPPFKRLRFVSCKHEMDFIRKHCRRGPTRGEGGQPAKTVEPSGEFCRHIIDTNISAMNKLGENLPSCACNEEMERLRYFRKLSNPVSDMTSGGSSDIAMTPSSSSCESFSEKTLLEDVENNIRTELITLKIPRRCKKPMDSEEGIIMERRNTTIGFTSGYAKFGPTSW